MHSSRVSARDRIFRNIGRDYRYRFDEAVSADFVPYEYDIETKPDISVNMDRRQDVFRPRVAVVYCSGSRFLYIVGERKDLHACRRGKVIVDVYSTVRLDDRSDAQMAGVSNTEPAGIYSLSAAANGYLRGLPWWACDENNVSVDPDTISDLYITGSGDLYAGLYHKAVAASVKAA